MPQGDNSLRHSIYVSGICPVDKTRRVSLMDTRRGIVFRSTKRREAMPWINVARVAANRKINVWR